MRVNDTVHAKCSMFLELMNISNGANRPDRTMSSIMTYIACSVLGHFTLQVVPSGDFGRSRNGHAHDVPVGHDGFPVDRDEGSDLAVRGPIVPPGGLFRRGAVFRGGRHAAGHAVEAVGRAASASSVPRQHVDILEVVEANRLRHVDRIGIDESTQFRASARIRTWDCGSGV